METILMIIKPEAWMWTKSILNQVKDYGLKIDKIKVTKLSRDEADRFFKQEHSSKPYYEDILDQMTAGPVTLALISGENAIKNLRKLIGSTNPEKAAEWTLRRKYSTSRIRNGIHGSDSVDAAKRETKFFEYKFNEKN